MRVVYMGKDKPSVIGGLEFLVRNGVDVVAVVGAVDETPSRQSLVAAAAQWDIPVRTDAQLYELIERDELSVDLVISFLYWKRIREPLINTPTQGCINFHPAPLPDFRGVGGYSIAILEGLQSWGVSAHFVDTSFDTGDLIHVRRFPINADEETALSLERKTQVALLEVFQIVMKDILAGHPLPRTPQGEGRYVSRQIFEGLRKITKEDTPSDIDRKIRAFWYPPHGGASVEMQGTEFTLVNDRMLNEIASLYENSSALRDPASSS